MAKYTTGELAKLCDVTVRTVQYYDSRGILVPDELSEGGRRIYSEDALRKLKVICFFRDVGLSIDSIKKLMSETSSEEVISALLTEQQKLLELEINERKQKLKTLEDLRTELKGVSDITADSIGDVANIVKNKSDMRRMHRNMLVIGFIMDAIEVSTLMLWIFTGNPLPFVIGLLPVICLGVWISKYYFHRTEYVCLQCHTVFSLKLREVFLARHTPKARLLTCPECGKRSFCIEIYKKSK